MTPQRNAAAEMRRGARTDETRIAGDGVSTRGCTLQLVYTSPDVALRGLDQGVRTRVGRSRALRHRVSRFVVSLLPRAQRSPPDGDGHAPSASPALLRADGDARVGARLPRAVPHRAEG